MLKLYVVCLILLLNCFVGSSLLKRSVLDENDDNVVVDRKNSSPATVNDDNWNYWGPHGEHYWEKYFRHCKGRFQSPINIETDRIVFVPEMQLSLINYDQPLRAMRLTNTGHGIMLQPTKQTLDSKVQCFAAGSALNNDIYRFLQFHFHWRNSHSSGSEHAIDGKKYSMEMHLVHQNVKYEKHESLINKILVGDLYMVIAVFFNETDRHNPTLDPIIEHMDNVINAHRSYTLKETIRLEHFLPAEFDRNQFYRYYGSYTTPDCQEIVTWIIFKQPLDIDQKQINKYRDLLNNITKHTHHHHHHHHIRPPFEHRLNNAFAKKFQLRNIHKFKQQGQDKVNNDDDNDDDDEDNVDVEDEEMIGYYRHIQEIGSRKIYAPMSMSGWGKQNLNLKSIIFLIIMIIIIC